MSQLIQLVIEFDVMELVFVDPWWAEMAPAQFAERQM